MKVSLLCPTVLLAACMAAPQAWAQSPSTTVAVEIVLSDPPSSCNFSVQSNLGFGTAVKPSSGTGTVTINAVSGVRSASGVTISGSSSVGQVSLSGSNVSSYTVSSTFPSSLTISGDSLSYSGTWAQSSSTSSGYASIATGSYSGSASGSGTSFTRYFRFGGEVGGIGISDAGGLYRGSISTSATCN